MVSTTIDRDHQVGTKTRSIKTVIVKKTRATRTPTHNQTERDLRSAIIAELGELGEHVRKLSWGDLCGTLNLATLSSGLASLENEIALTMKLDDSARTEILDQLRPILGMTNLRIVALKIEHLWQSFNGDESDEADH